MTRPIRHILLCQMVVAGGCSVAGPRFAETAPEPFAPVACRKAITDVALYGDDGLSYERPPDGPDPLSYGEITPAVVVGMGAGEGEVATTVEHSVEVAVGPYPDFSYVPPLPVGAADGEGGRLGFLRTRDRFVSPTVYSSFGDRDRTACGLVASCPTPTPVAGLLDELRTEARERGIDEVRRVRCFGRNVHRTLRVWCEAELYLSEERATTCSS